MISKKSKNEGKYSFNATSTPDVHYTFGKIRMNDCHCSLYNGTGHDILYVSRNEATKLWIEVGKPLTEEQVPSMMT